MNGKHVLLIEDNKDVQDFNKPLLESQGFAVEAAMTLADARSSVARQTPDVIVLDIGMPDGSGLDFLREFRLTSNTPVLLLTGYKKDDDIVKGFEYGCNDYLTKPYTFAVLLARLKNLLKGAEQVPETITRGSLTLNIPAERAYINKQDLFLSNKEFSLLLFFMQNENRVMSADFLYEKIWGQPMCDNKAAVEKMVSRLRQSLHGSGYDIRMKRRQGYSFGTIE